MKTVWMAAAMAGVMAVSVQAEMAATPAPAPEAKAMTKKNRPEGAAMELVGKLVQEERVGKTKDGAEVKKTVALLEVADGAKVFLPPKTKDGAATSAFVGKTVKVVGKGHAGTGKKGKKFVRLFQVVSIEEVAAP